VILTPRRFSRETPPGPHGKFQFSLPSSLLLCRKIFINFFFLFSRVAVLFTAGFDRSQTALVFFGPSQFFFSVIVLPLNLQDLSLDQNEISVSPFHANLPFLIFRNWTLGKMAILFGDPLPPMRVASTFRESSVCVFLSCGGLRLPLGFLKVKELSSPPLSQSSPLSVPAPSFLLRDAVFFFLSSPPSRNPHFFFSLRFFASPEFSDPPWVLFFFFSVANFS